MSTGFKCIYTLIFLEKRLAQQDFIRGMYPSKKIMISNRSVASVRRYQKAGNVILVDISNKLNPAEWKSKEQIALKSETFNKPSTEMFKHDMPDDEPKYNQPKENPNQPL